MSGGPAWHSENLSTAKVDAIEATFLAAAEKVWTPQQIDAFKSEADKVDHHTKVHFLRSALGEVVR